MNTEDEQSNYTLNTDDAGHRTEGTEALQGKDNQQNREQV